MNDRIKAIRKYTGTKVSELAKALGVTASYIYGLESGEKTKLSDTLIELFVERFSINRVWLETGAGSPFSTSQTVEKDALTGLIHEYIDRIERVLEIITWSKVSDEHRLYHLLRFNDGNYLLITTQPIPTYNNDNISIEIHDAREELQQRDIPILQLQLEDHWFNEYVLFPKREKLEALFFHKDIAPLGQAVMSLPPKQGDSSVIAAGWKVSEALVMAARVFESKTSYADALYLNVVHFDRAVQAEVRIGQMVMQQQAQADDLADIKKRVAVLEHECAELHKENDSLKSRRPVDPPAAEVTVPTAIPLTKSTGRKNT